MTRTMTTPPGDSPSGPSHAPRRPRDACAAKAPRTPWRPRRERDVRTSRRTRRDSPRRRVIPPSAATRRRTAVWRTGRRFVSAPTRRRIPSRVTPRPRPRVGPTATPPRSSPSVRTDSSIRHSRTSKSPGCGCKARAARRTTTAPPPPSSLSPVAATWRRARARSGAAPDGPIARVCRRAHRPPASTSSRPRRRMRTTRARARARGVFAADRSAPPRRRAAGVEACRRT